MSQIWHKQLRSNFAFDSQWFCLTDYICCLCVCWLKWIRTSSIQIDANHQNYATNTLTCCNVYHQTHRVHYCSKVLRSINTLVCSGRALAHETIAMIAQKRHTLAPDWGEFKASCRHWRQLERLFAILTKSSYHQTFASLMSIHLFLLFKLNFVIIVTLWALVVIGSSAKHKKFKAQE